MRARVRLNEDDIKIVINSNGTNYHLTLAEAKELQAGLESSIASAEDLLRQGKFKLVRIRELAE